MSTVAAAVGSEAVWHDAECGGYAADLPLWNELAGAATGPTLELGCGTGRVALALARNGHRVSAVDSDPALVATLAQRSRAAGLGVETFAADVCELALEAAFGLIVAPMQLIQLLPGAEVRALALARTRAHLPTGGRVALAIVEGVPEAAAARRDEAAPPLPDVREVDGWVHSSLPLGAEPADGGLLVRRLRQLVSPAGELSEEIRTERLAVIDAATLEAEALRAGLFAVDRLAVPATDAHIGSSIVVLEAAR